MRSARWLLWSIPVMALPACSGGHPSRPQAAPAVTTTTSPRIRPCDGIPAATLSSAVGGPVRLDTVRSEPAAGSTARTAVICAYVFTSGATRAAGTIELAAYGSAAAARSDLQAGLAAAAGLGTPASIQSADGTATYAEQVPDGWICVSVAGADAAQATVAAPTSGPACAWSRAGVRSLGAAGL